MQAKIWNHSEWIAETDPDALRKKYDALLRRSGFGVLEFVEHHFQPQGWTAIWVLCESHFAVHTFPEFGKTYIELASCNLAFYKEFITLTNEVHDGDEIVP